MAKERACAVCDGTGKLVLMNSWFIIDGFRRARCGICHGTGKSSFRDGPYEASQRRLRALASVPVASVARAA